MTINFTLDFNCLISLENNDSFASDLQKLVELHEKNVINLYVPAISANEKQINGEYADSIEQFFERIDKLSKRRFEILKPIAIWNMGYWDYCIWYDDEMMDLVNKIHLILFPNLPVNHLDYAKIHDLDPEILSPKWRNPRCDVISLWCHIFYKNDIFITNDVNFHKKTKQKPLISLGSNKILRSNSALIELGY
jgi:hypothetical protein